MKDLLEKLKSENNYMFEDTTGVEDTEIKQKMKLHKWHSNRAGV